jgi:hypothetical protein
MQPLLGLAVSVHSWKVGIEIARQPAKTVAKTPIVPSFSKDSAVTLYTVRGASGCAQTPECDIRVIQIMFPSPGDTFHWAR